MCKLKIFYTSTFGNERAKHLFIIWCFISWRAPEGRCY